MSEVILKVAGRLATKQDLLLASGVLRFGTAVFLRSFKTGKISGPHVIDKYTCSKELERFFKHSYVFVAASVLDNDVELVFQSGLKKEMELNEHSA